MNRTANCERRTNETKIQVTLGLDGTGKTSIHTGIGFLTTCWTVLPAMAFRPDGGGERRS